MSNLLFLQNLRGGEIIIIAIVILLLFGGKKIPELMKGVGKGIRSFKDGMKGIEDEINNDESSIKKTN
ncbi:MAG: twin-arginine translocase TatA/TatE family subunit [Dysgonamonadaceae bacterium]|jgi:sec-independent protein translocase protein TatA|nr:twin-arginine translocase TatA/TatE family subunit [Dysgonamonadaceae bacterium]